VGSYLGLGVSLTFESVSAPGTTSVTTSSADPVPAPSDWRVLDGLYFDVSTTAEHQGDVVVGVPYNPTGLSDAQEQALALLRFDGESWVDVTSSADRTKHVLYGTVPHLSWFAVAYPSNLPPEVSLAATGGASEGSPFTRSGSFVDPDSTVWSATVDFGDGSGVQTLPLSGSTFSLLHTYADNGVYEVKVTVTDDGGAAGSATRSVNVANVAPAVGPISAPLDPVKVGTPVTASASFADPGVLDTHTAVWDWEGATSTGSVNETKGSGTVSGSHAFTTPGVYTVKLTVTDKDGDATHRAYEYVIVYDPAGGFVTGGGWINSPAGAYVADPALTGKATFGFVSKYAKAATLPSGSTEFVFHAGNLNFQSATYDWLVIAGARAQYKGTGTINGAGTYGVLLTAIDGQVSGGGGLDKLRIKVWDKASGTVVYDNKLGAADSANPTTTLGGGSIVVHK